MNILFILIGAFLIIMGGLIWRFKILEVVAFYEENKIKDKNRLARWVGINYIIMGLLVIGNSILGIMLEQVNDMETLVVFTVIFITCVFVMSLGSKKYEK